MDRLATVFVYCGCFGFFLLYLAFGGYIAQRVEKKQNARSSNYGRSRET